MKNLGNMMKQAQQMQQRMQEMQAQLDQLEMSGAALVHKVDGPAALGLCSGNAGCNRHLI